VNKKPTLRSKIIDFWYIFIDFIEWYRDPKRTDWNFVVFTNRYGEVLSYWSGVKK